MIPMLVDARQTNFSNQIADHPLGSLFSSPPWMEAVSRTYDLPVSASARSVLGQRQDAVLFTQVSDLRGERVVCGPFSDYCDPLTNDADIWRELIAPILALRLPVTLRCLRSDAPMQDDRFRPVGEAAWHGVDIARPEDEIWAGFAGPARQNIRKALRNGVQVREGRTLEDVRLFHAMHCHVRKTKYRMLAQPMDFFHQLHELFAAENRLTVLFAEAEGTPLAGILFLEWGNTLYYKFNASWQRDMCPNDLLVWEGIRMGRRHGLRRLDFGASDYDQPGLLRYKRKFATDEMKIHRLRWEPEGYSDPRAAQAGQMLGRMTQLLTDPAVPDAVTRAAGDEFYGFFC